MKKIELNEQDLRYMVECSVKKILKEMSVNEHDDEYDIEHFDDYDYDGPESPITVPLDDDDFAGVVRELAKSGEFGPIELFWNTEYDEPNDELFKAWPEGVEVYFDIDPGTSYDPYLNIPGSPAEYEMGSYYILGIDEIQNEQMRNLIKAAVDKYMEEYFDLDSYLN